MAQGVDGAFLSQCYDKPVMVHAKESKDTREDMCAPWIKVAGLWTDVALFGEENFVALNADGHVYKRVAGVLTQVEGVLKTIVSDNVGSTWWGINACGQLYRCAGKAMNAGESWTNVANDTIRAQSISLNPKGTCLYVLTRDGHVWVHKTMIGHWKCVTTMGPITEAHKLLIDSTGRLLYIDTSRAVWRATGTDTMHWGWERLEHMSNIESACIGPVDVVNGTPRIYGITAQHTIMCFYSLRGTTTTLSKPMTDTGRARLVTYHSGSLACINDSGELFWRPSA